MIDNMDLRDYFAAQAMQAIANVCFKQYWYEYESMSSSNTPENWALEAYAIAEAMIKAREES